MRTLASALVSVLALLPVGLGSAAAQEPHPNPNALLEQWLEDNQQKNIEAALLSAKQHSANGEKDAAIADYRKVLSLAPQHPDAVAGLKALGVDDASVPASLTHVPLDGKTNSGGPNSSPPPASGGDGGGLFPNGLY